MIEKNSTQNAMGMVRDGLLLNDDHMSQDVTNVFLILTKHILWFDQR